VRTRVAPWIVLALAFAPCATRAGIAFDSPYVGEVRIFAFGFCPNGWRRADGSLVPIAASETLFNLYGTTFGGDGETTFAMPDLRGRVPIARGQGPGLGSHGLGEPGGNETVTLTAAQLPAHTHAARASSQSANAVSPAGTLRAPKPRTPYHRTSAAANTQLAAGAIQPAGSSQPADNVPPFLAMTPCVSEFGVFPPSP
jgi:microcystin-dependent protein